LPKREGDKLILETIKPILTVNQSIGVDFNITIPKQTDLRCDSSRGSIEVSNLEGNMNGKTSRGSISINNLCGSAQLHTSRGSITCDGVSGDNFKLKNSRGNINVSTVSVESLDLESSRGSINVSESSASKMRIFTSRGHVTCNEITANDLTGGSSRGNVKIIYAATSPAQINADLAVSRGNIELTAPSNYAGQIELTARRGSINTDLPIKVKGDLGKKRITGTIGQGSGKLYLKTSRGSISIK